MVGISAEPQSSYEALAAENAALNSELAEVKALLVVTMELGSWVPPGFREPSGPCGPLDRVNRNPGWSGEPRYGSG